MIKRYKYRIYPTQDQNHYFQRVFGCCRFVYNWALDKKKSHYEQNNESDDFKPLSIYDISKQLTKLKKDPEYDWLKEPPAVALIWSLNHLDDAYKNFFRRVKRGEEPGFPRFKAKHHSKKAFSFHQGYSVNFDECYITVPKSGKVDTVFHREFEGEYKTATVMQEPSGKFYVSIVVDDGLEAESLNEPDRLVGIDHGCINALTISTGKVFDIDCMFPRLEKRLKRYKRDLSRKVVGSNNYGKNKIKVAKVYEKIRFKRKINIQNMICDLILYLQHKDIDGVIIRKYDVKGMLERIEPKKDENGKYVHNGRGVQKQINRKISASNLGYVFEHLQFKLKENGMHCFIMDAAAQKTTERCNNCGEEKAISIDLKDRMLRCGNCGFIEDIDLNAAKNIHGIFMQNNEAIEVA